MLSAATPPRPASLQQWAIVLYAVLPVVALLSFAVYRLFPIAMQPLRDDPSAGTWVAYAVSVVLMAWAEGYRGFHQQFSPRVVVRGLHLSRRRGIYLALAPAVAMGWVYATRRRLITSWSLTFGIVLLVVLMHLLDQPWRGVVDAGVVVGLGWGILSILYFLGRAALGSAHAVPADMPAAAR